MNENLDFILNRKLDVGILEYEETEYFIDLVFKDGTKASLWNENKYYEWLSKGFIGFFRWRNSRPSRPTMRRLNYAINAYTQEQNKVDERAKEFKQEQFPHGYCRD